MTTSTSSTGSYSSSLSSSIQTTESYAAKQAAAAASSSSSTMGQDAFLKLFTTQLQNQDPTDPVKNEAFVAQLAQFSQLEALESMKSSLDSMSSVTTNERMFGAASLLGKTVSVPNGPVTVTDTTVSQGTVTLPSGASDLIVQVSNSSGSVIRTMDMGAQTAGDVTIEWDGKDDSGNTAANGTYSYAATATVNGTSSAQTVNTYATVTGVVNGSTAGSYTLQFAGNKTMSLDDVTKISY